MIRNPLEDPQPDDVIQASGLQLHVHFRKPDQVYCGRFTEAGEDRGTVRCDMATWRKSAALYSPQVIQRAEDGPTPKEGQ